MTNHECLQIYRSQKEWLNEEKGAGNGYGT